jgi:hypothetical protein
VKQVYVARDPIQANVLKELLESHGIEAVVQGERLFSVRGEVPVVYPTVFVRDEQAAEALEVVKGFSESEKGTTEEVPESASWKCPVCGQENDAKFTECWQCAKQEPQGEPAAEDAQAQRSQPRPPRVLGVIFVVLVILLSLLWYREHLREEAIRRSYEDRHFGRKP